VSEFATLHPYDPRFVRDYVAAVRGDLPGAQLLPAAPEWANRELARAQRGYQRALAGDEVGANLVSHELARLLGAGMPVYFVPGAGLTQLEARFDRGLGMLLRPPSRLFMDAGLESTAARRMPIRLDASGGSMGGAFVSPALVPQFRAHIEARLERLARRMAEAEMDAPAYVGILLEAATFAESRGFGLFEAADVVVPGVAESEPPGLTLLQPDRKRLDKSLRQQLEEAARPPKEPGLFARIFRGAKPAQTHVALDDPRLWRGLNDVTPPPERPTAREEAPQ
jgi:hypothetical protein